MRAELSSPSHSTGRVSEVEEIQDFELSSSNP